MIRTFVAIAAAAIECDFIRRMILMRRGVAAEARRLADAEAARLHGCLILEARARRAAVGEELAASFRAVGDHQRLVAIVVFLAGAELLVAHEQRKERLVRTVTAVQGYILALVRG